MEPLPLFVSTKSSTNLFKLLQPSFQNSRDQTDPLETVFDHVRRRSIFVQETFTAIVPRQMISIQENQLS